MVQAKELRIGNLVSDNAGDIVPIIAISQISVTVKWEDESNELSFKHIDGVILTQEILVKCGFILDDKKDWGKLSLNGSSNFYIQYLTEIYHFYIVQFRTAGIMPHCQYLHQLQNLYYALTGEELEINL